MPTVEVARRSGATYRQLDYWARTDLLVPEVLPARGCGSGRRYSEDDVALAHILRQISSQAVPFRSGRRIVEVLRTNPEAWDAFLVADGTENVIVTLTPTAYLTDGTMVACWVIVPAAARIAVREEVPA